MFGHLLGQIEFWKALVSSTGPIGRRSNSSSSSSFKLTGASDRLAGIASEIHAEEKAILEANMKEIEWKPVYLALLSETKELFAKLSIPEPAMAPGFRP